MKKGFVLGLATGLTIAGASLVLANSQIQAILNNQIKVTLNGQVQEFKDETTNETQYPITYHDRTYLPLRTVANLVGVGVDYDSNTNTAKLTDEFNLYHEMSKLDYSNTLISESDYKIEISSDGKNIKIGDKNFITNLNKNIKSFKVVKRGIVGVCFVALTEDGELYMHDGVIHYNDDENYDFELLGSGYDAISSDITYRGGDFTSDPFVARSVEVENGSSFVDYTIFMSNGDKIQINSHRP